MKTTTTKYWAAVGAAILTVAAASRAPAGQAATITRPEKIYTGKVTAVDLKEHMLKAKGFLFSKQFNLGVECQYTPLDKAAGTANDLRPGEEVAVSYQNVGGVLVADSIKQLPMRFDGMVKCVNPTNHMMTVHVRALDKTFQIADNCDIELRNDKPGTLADIQSGNHVTVTYEMPGNTPIAREILQTSDSFTGTLTAIDLGERTVKAKALFDTKKFNVGNNCAIVINGKTDGQLADLKPDEKLVFSYDDVNGINVVNRIAPAQAETNSNSIVFTEPGSGY